MIEFTKAFKTEDGTIHSTIRQAQEHSLQTLLEVGTFGKSPAVAEFLVENADKVVDILTTKASSKPKARAVNGGKKTRKAQVEAAP